MILHNSTANLQLHNNTDVGYDDNCKGALSVDPEYTVAKSKILMRRETPAVANSSSSRSNSILRIKWKSLHFQRQRCRYSTRNTHPQQTINNLKRINHQKKNLFYASSSSVATIVIIVLSSPIFPMHFSHFHAKAQNITNCHKIRLHHILDIQMTDKLCHKYNPDAIPRNYVGSMK